MKTQYYLIAVLVFVAISSALLPNQVFGQTCSCNEYIYLNEVTNGGKVHKYQVASDGSLSEINPGGPWYPNGGSSELSSPHGLGVDNNGFLYIASSWQSGGKIRRLDCDGNIRPTSEFVINNAGTFNIMSIGNTIYANTSGSEEITAYSTCDGSIQGSLCFQDIPCASWENGNCAGYDWGFYYDERTGYFYSAFPQDQNDNGGNSNKKSTIYRYTVADFSSPGCVAPFVESTSTTFGQLPSVGANEIPLTNISGIGTDDQGNIYYVATGYLEPGQIIKLDPNGNFLAASAIDAADGNGGFWGARAIVWSETSGDLYVSTQTTTSTEDCISRFDTDLNYLGSVVNATGNTGQGQSGFGSGKAMYIAEECCPDFADASVEQTICVPAAGTVISLIDYLPCDNICAGDWTEVSNSGAGVFNDCNNSFTFLQPGSACFEMTYSPSGPNALCDAFTIDLCINISCYSIGNQVFEDADNSGDLNGSESGINGVTLQLLNPDGSLYDSDPTTSAIDVMQVTTANGGYYRFDGLPEGDYIVEVVGSNFSSGNPLEDLLYSTGPNQEADPNSDGDTNDNGLDTPVAGAIQSGVITLGPGAEPTGEAQPGSYGAGSFTGIIAADDKNNLTVDFGFYACIPPVVEPDFVVCSPISEADLEDATAGHNWSFLSGPATASIDASTGAVSGMSTDGVYTFAYTREEDNCVAEVRITQLQPNAGEDQLFCAPSTTANLGLAPAGFEWSFTNGPATASVDPNSGAVTGMSDDGDYIFTITYLDTGCTDDVLITRLPAPDAGSDDNVCAPEEIYTLSAPGAGETWSVVSSPIFTSPAVDATGNVTGLTTAGAYRFRLSNGTCFDEVVIDKNNAPNAGPDVGVCEPETTSDLPNQFFGTTWSFTSGPATATINPTTGAIDGLTDNGEYIFTATNPDGCTDEVIVTRSAAPVADPEISLCGSANSTVDLTDAGPGETWSVESAPWLSPAAVDPVTGVVTGLTSAGNHVLRLTNETGCYAETNIGVGTQPDAGDDITICEPEDLLYFELPAPGAGNVYEFVDGPAVPNLTFYWYATGFTENGTYTIRLVNSASGCADTLEVVRLAGPDAGYDQEICNAQTTTQLVAPGADEEWSCSNCIGAEAVDPLTGAATGLTAWKNYNFVLTNNVTGCFTEVTVVHNLLANINSAAGPDLNICSPSTTLDIEIGVATDQAWNVVSQPAGANAMVTAGPEGTTVTGLTEDGDYTLELVGSGDCDGLSDEMVITRETAPQADEEEVLICDGSNSTTLTPAGTAFVEGWYAPPLGENPSNATIGVLNGNINGMANDGVYRFFFRDVSAGSGNCQDTVYVTKATPPDAGPDISVCSPETSIDLADAPAGQVWSAQTGNPSAATIDPSSGEVSGMTADGDYTFILDNLGCTDEVVVSRVVAPLGGEDLVLCLNEDVDLPDAGADEAWMVDPNNPLSSVIDAATGVVSDATNSGFYNYILTNSVSTCADTVQVQLESVPNATPNSMEVCEDAQGSGSGTFDLTSLDALISDDPITWYEDVDLLTSIAAADAFVSGATTVYAEAANDNCEAVAEVVLTVQELPLAEATVVCLGGNGTGQITVDASVGSGTLEYSLNGAPYQTSNEFVNTADGNYTIFVRVVGTTCVTNLVDVLVECDCDDPEVFTADPDPVCSPGTVDISTAVVITTNTGVTTTFWQDAAATIPLDATTGLETAIQVSGIYYIKSEASNPVCFTVAPVQVTIHPEADLGGPYEMTLCDDAVSTVNLSELIIGYGNFTNVNWTDGTDPVSDPTAVMPSADASYTLTADDANGCPGIATINVTVQPIPTLTYSVTDCDENGMRTLTVDANIDGDGALEYAFNLSVFGPDNVFTFEAISTPQVLIEVRAEGGDCIVSEIYNVENCPPPPSFDLALTKRVAMATPSPFTPGKSVSFDVMVYNQGTVTAYDIDVDDYFNASELTFVDLTLPTTSMGANPITVMQDAANPAYEIDELAAGDAVLVTYNFTVNPSFVGTSIINNAEIIDASETDGGTTAVDEDSPLTEINDGSTNELDTDDNIEDEAIGTPGSEDLDTDEDDYDPAQIAIIEPTCTIPTFSVSALEGTCTDDTANDDASIALSDIVNANEANYSMGASYIGPSYGDPSGIALTGSSATILDLMHDTEYIVRIWNAEDGCFADLTITTPSKECDPLCPDPNCLGVTIQKND